MKTEIRDRGKRWKYITDPQRFACNLEEFASLAEKERDEKKSWLGYDFYTESRHVSPDHVWWEWPIHGQDNPWWGISAAKIDWENSETRKAAIPIEVKQLESVGSYPVIGEDNHYSAKVSYSFHGLGRDRNFGVRQEAKVENIHDFGIKGLDTKVVLEEISVSNFTKATGSTSVAHLTLNAEKISSLPEELKEKMEIPKDLYPGQHVHSYLNIVEAGREVRLYRPHGREVVLSPQELEMLGFTRLTFKDGVEDVRLTVTVHDFPVEIDLSRELKPGWWKEIFGGNDGRKVNPVTKTRIKFGQRECCE